MIVLQPFEWSLVAGVVVSAFELVSGAFVFLGFGVGFLATGCTQAVMGNVNLGRDAFVFVIVSAGVVLVARAIFGRHGDSRKPLGDVNDY